MTKKEQVDQLENDWNQNDRWEGITRPYTADEVVNLRGSVQIEHTLGKNGAEKFWEALKGDEVISALGALTGNQAIQEVQAGLKAVYCSGWQVAGDANSAGAMYPDQSLYPVDSVPKLVERINNSLLRTDEIHWMNDDDNIDWMVPLIADAEAGFGGNLNAFELMKAMIKAGAAAVHWEDQLSSAKKCGHMGGKVLVSTQEAINKLVAARLAADVMGVPSVIIARTDANAANLITTDNDIRDKRFITGERTSEGFYAVNNGLDQAIDRGLSYAPYADLLWCETAKPNLKEARRFAEAIHEKYPGKLLCYNCSPSFNWKQHLDDATIAKFQRELAAMGYKFQFVTLAGFHALNLGMFDLAKSYKEDGMLAYSNFQEMEFKHERDSGYMATTHQKFVGTGYFDRVMNCVSLGKSSVGALSGSTEEEQF